MRACGGAPRGGPRDGPSAQQGWKNLFVVDPTEVVGAAAVEESKQDLFSSYLSLRLVSLSSLVSRFPAIAPAYSRSPSNFATGHHLLARRLRILEVGSTDQFR